MYRHHENVVTLTDLVKPDSLPHPHHMPSQLDVLNTMSLAEMEMRRAVALQDLLVRGQSLLWETDAKGRVTSFTARGHNASGLDTNTVLNTDWTSFVDPLDQVQVLAAWSAARAAGTVLTCEARILTGEGGSRWHRVSAAPVCDIRGELVSWVGTARDIHDQKLRETEFIKALEVLNALERCGDGLLYLKDREGRLVWCNDAVLDVLGKNRIEALGHLATAYMREDRDAHHVTLHDMQVVNEGRALLTEEILHDPHRVYLSCKTPWRDRAGSVVGLVGVSINVTNEARIRSQWNPEFAKLHHATPIVVSRFDKDLKHLYVSPAIETITGMPPATFFGKSNRDLGMPSHLCDQWDNVMHAVLADGCPREIEFSYAGPDEKQRVFRSLLSAEKDGHGKPSTLVAVAYEVTELKAQQALVREREARLAAALSAGKLQTWTYLIGENVFLVPVSTRRQHAIRGDSDRVCWADAFCGIHRDDVERVQQSLLRCAHDKVDYDETYRVQDDSGHWRWVRAAGRHVPHDTVDGGASHIAGVTFDLTEEREAQQRLRDSEESLRLAVDAVDAGRYDWDLATGELKWDARTRALFHLPAGQEPSYDHFLSRLHPDDRVRLAARVGAQLDGSKSDGIWSERYRVLQPDGTLRWLESQGRVMFTENETPRRPMRFIGLVTDVTAEVETAERLAASEGALRKSLSALAESEERMRLAMESSSLGWWDMDVPSTRIVWSGSARRLFDMPEEGDVHLDEVLVRVYKEDLPRVRLAIESAMASHADGIFHESYRVLWRDGSLRDVEAIGRVRFEHRDSGRQATRFSGVLWDTTETCTMWRTLQDKGAYVEALLRTAPVGILSVDEAGHITRSNPLMDSLFGPLGRGAQVRDESQRWESYCADGTRLAQARYPVLQVLDGSIRSEVEVQHVTSRDGRSLWLRLIASPVVQQDRPAGAVMVCVDIDAERRTLEVLKEADARKEQFFAMLAHEIRNPLGAISNANHILSRDAHLSEPSIFARGVITRQSKQLQCLVDDLLEVSRISRDSFTLKTAPTSIRQVLLYACDPALIRAQARRQRLTISVPEQDVVANVDPTRLSQVLDNLLGNAVKYTPEGGAIEVTLTSSAEYAEVTISDNGMGIQVDELDKVFDLFHQQKTQDRHAALGFGIGLAMVRRLVELHGGRVWAESQGPGTGAKFVVQIPLGTDAHNSQ